ncbi:MAG: hypothetical protein WAL75_23975 [Terracidiphilus sp.]
MEIEPALVDFGDCLELWVLKTLGRVSGCLYVQGGILVIAPLPMSPPLPEMRQENQIFGHQFCSRDGCPIQKRNGSVQIFTGEAGIGFDQVELHYIQKWHVGMPLGQLV